MRVREGVRCVTSYALGILATALGIGLVAGFCWCLSHLIPLVERWTGWSGPWIDFAVSFAPGVLAAAIVTGYWIDVWRRERDTTCGVGDEIDSRLLCGECGDTEEDGADLEAEG